MAESKKRWLALIMAVVMLAALLPESFLSAAGVQGENSSKPGRNTETVDNTEKITDNTEKETTDNTSEKKTVIYKFKGWTQLKDEIFSFILYDKNNEIILQLDNLGKEDKTELSDESGIEISTKTDDIYLTVTLKNLDVNESYSYKFESSGDTEYDPVTEIIDLDKTLSEIELVESIDVELPYITLYVSQKQTETMDIIYKIYEAVDNQIKGDVLVEDKIEEISSDVKKVCIKTESGFFAEQYGIEFYNNDNKLLSIQYVNSSNGRVLGTENTPVDITKDIEPLELQISYENSGNTYTDINNPNNKYYQKRTAILKANKNSDRIDINTLRKKITESISFTTVNNLNNPLTLTLSEKAEDGTYHVTDEKGTVVLKISEWNELDNSYNIEFVQSGKYLWNNIEYSDKSGNIASVSFSKIEGSTEDDNTFFIDNTGPKADCFINFFPDIHSQRARTDGGLLEKLLRNTSLQLATNLSDTEKSEFCLENVSDDYSGISKVDYYVFEEKKDYQSLTEWTSWINGISDINHTNLCVSKDTDGIYYMYYRLEDNIGNISYYDGLGFKLDVTPPEIVLSYSIDNGGEYKTISGSAIEINKDVKIKAVITETNLTDDNIILKINGKSENNFKILQENNLKELTFDLTANENEDIAYNIELVCTDDAGHSSTATAEVIIDKKSPVINCSFTPTHSWENDTITFFSDDVEAVLAIEDVRFNKDNSIVSIKKNEEKEVLLSSPDNGYGENNWKKTSDNSTDYKTTLKFTAGSNTDDKYIIKITYTDNAGNNVEYKKTIMIDTNPPVVSIKFTDNQNPVGNYYKMRTAEISVTEESSLDMKNFKAAIEAGISVTDKDSQKIDINDKKNQFYEISENGTLKNAYIVTFKGDGHYNLNISYTDKCGNITEQAATAEFSIDTTPPTAVGYVELYRYMDKNPLLLETYNLIQQIRTTSYLSTYFEIMGEKYPSKFILTDIQDNLSGVKDIKYYLVNSPLDETIKLEELDDTDWKDENTESTDQKFIVTLPEQENPKAYYIYYRIEDNAGNKAYYNGAGILLDQENPDIKEFTYTYDKDVKRIIDEQEEIEGKKINVYTFSDNVKINFQIEETNFNKEKTEIKIEKYDFKEKNYKDISNLIGKPEWTALEGDQENMYSTLLSTNIEGLKTEKNQINQYKITVQTEDMVERTDKRTEIIRIDKELATITVEYIDDDNDDQPKKPYYKEERTAKIQIEKTIYSFVNPEEFRKAIVNGMGVKNEKYTDIIKAQEIQEQIPAATEDFQVKIEDTQDTPIYTISKWDSDSNSYTITFHADAIYEWNINYTDIGGNKSKTEYPSDENSFVIDRQAPQITVCYDNVNMVQKSYYKEERTSVISVKDLSFSYYYYKEKKDLSELEKYICFDIKADNPFGETLEISNSKWEATDGIFKSTIIYKSDAVYTFEITGRKDICENELLKPEEIKYFDKNQNAITDGKSFVIDKTAPIVTVSYDNTNKSQTDFSDGYYKGDRTATISVQDLSLYYYYQTAKQIEESDFDINWEIKLENEKTEILENSSDFYKEDGQWTFVEDEKVFQYNICYQGEAIYSFHITQAQDKCQNKLKTNKEEITYTDTDGQFFVIDKTGPQVTVTYDNTNELKKKDHFYYGKRTAQIYVTDLSFVYASRNKENINDILEKKIKKEITAVDTKGNRIEEDIIEKGEWSFNNGIYQQKIEFNGEAIYSFDLSLIQDLCGIKSENKNIQYNVSDGKSFVIDKTAPKITVIYHDSNANKQEDRYYKDSRTVDIIVEDLSYIYEEELAESKNLTPENRISDWIEITAKDAKGNLVTDAFKKEKWIFLKSDSSNLLSGVYKKTICFEKDAIYTFSILNNGEASADIYDNKATIVYKNILDDKQIDVKDYDSFVISRKAPDVYITYNDNSENKLKNHYYKGERTATIMVSDLSFVYEDSQKKDLDSLAADKIQIQITAENEKAEQLTDSYSIKGWNFDRENGVYIQEIIYTGDAIYSWNISGKNIYRQDIQTKYQNKNNQNVEDYGSFVIDRQAPVITVLYNDNYKVSDYFYNGQRTAQIKVSDLSYVYEDRQRNSQEGNMSVTPDERVEIKITAKDETDKIAEDVYKESGWNFDTKNGVYLKDINFEKDAIYKYENSATDIYGRQGEFSYINIDSSAEETILPEKNIKDWNSFVIDTEAPVVTVTYDDRNKGTNTTKPEYTNGYYRDNRTAHITVSDLSFVYADKYMPEHADASLVLNATDNDANTYILPDIRAYSNDMEKNVENAHTMNLESLWSWNEAYNGYQADITFLAEADYTFSITGKDICKNPANVSYSDVADANRFVIDKTAPTISITYNDNTPVRTIDGRGYFARTRTATVVITEGCDTFDSGDALENIVITARDAAGNDVGSDNYTVSGWTESKASANGNATRYTAEITYRGNANYTFAISYTDKTGHTASEINTNESASPYTFTVDSAAPTGTVSVSGFGSWNSLAELVTFDRWSNSTVNITASADDRISSVYSVKYYKTPAVTAMTRQQLLDLNDSLWTEYRAFSIKPDEMFSVYLRIEDRSGNISFISSDGIIVDATAPNEESIAPEITVTPVQPVNNIYNTDVTVDITVTDPIINGSYSGLKNIRYEIQNMGTVTQQGELYAFDYTAGQTLQSQLLQRWNGQITVDRNLNNSNDVRIVVYAQDNSDNTSSAYTSVQIDVTQPSIDISYDNNNGDVSFGTETYFNADRTATIRIMERNFNADDVQITITNTDGIIPSVSGWSSFAGTGNGDDAVHTATITYSADGDYVFAISYADLAGNINTAANYGNSLAPEQFTIDKTLPLINVTYDNNSVQNDNYYNAVRTATISITEHNFDTGRYTITLAASDDGVEKTAPSIGGWSNNGDIHTASVQFTDDGYYSMNMSYTDMAGNQAVQFTQQTFYVDQTMPRIEVRGIRNNTANNNETIGFEITCTDTNFDVFTPQLSVTKMTDGRNVTENCEINQRKDIKNGQIYTVENLEQDGIYSLTCTARDKAGNIFDKVVYLNDAGQEESSMDASEGISFLNFSVNRRGSVYMLDSYTDEVAKEYYIKEIDEDLIIVETNVDTLDSYIELNGKKLIEGTDYQMEISGGNGEWYVVRYIIHKELFAGEGEYKVVIYSEDNAGNTAYSDIKGTNMSFIIDKTAPVVTVAGIENNGRYQVERQTVTVIPKDDGGKLQKITIEAFDQNGDRIDGFPIVYEGEELVTLLEQNNGELSFELPEGTGMSVRITCEDAAGNEMDVMSFDNIVVSTNRLTIILADRRFIYAVITGALTLTVMIVLLIVWRKHKKKQSRDNSGTEQE